MRSVLLDRTGGFCYHIHMENGQAKSRENSFTRIYEVVKRIPRGKVATYGQIARLCGNPKWARIVGYALHVNPEPIVIPCHRVVDRSGRLSPAFAFGGENVQAMLLEKEGIPVLGGHVNMELYQWRDYEEN